ncbi:hypothetical protein O6H91_08G077600 [Diphasiastrum complanatum]|uniref:Uncharacterized protein n=2 Tax=Diphasiastrum complanatum TaxID=34168 RepID=A0ACC2CZ35_DIPCM|nr:hypothetical protein O6H91_08G077600 [Diphasiastrum complanatum]KAJ7547261.1 hypothetical protein O6H91_08G077600 [Diphasiastrum complanatum]
MHTSCDFLYFYLFVSGLMTILANLMVCESAYPQTCHESCGSIEIPFPFGVSSDCGLPGFTLICSNDSTLFFPVESNLYKVLGLKSNTIILDPLLSAQCDKPNLPVFTSINRTFYAVTRSNYLMLYSCRNLTGCPQNCSFSGYELPFCKFPACCYDLRYSNLSLVNINLFNAGCSTFMSWVANWKLGDSQPLLLYLQAQYGFELEWGIPGDCPNSACATHANCSSGDAVAGFTCHCNPGFAGDGYKHGYGCQPVIAAACNETVTSNCICPSGKLAVKDGCPIQHSKLRMIAGILAGGIGLIILLLVLSFIGRIICGQKPGKRCKSDMKQLALLLSFNNALDSTTIFTYKELERATKGFSESEMVGHGGYGTVYGGKLHDGRCVAIKKITQCSTEGIQQLINEVKVLSTVNHPNLVKLLGCCLDVQQPFLVYEFVSNGTLGEHLQQERGAGLDWFTRLNIVAETARALAYLHFTVYPPIYHRDIKSSNILLDQNWNTKVADFGLSRPVLSDESHLSTLPQGTLGYMDPQYHQNFHLSDKSDVYSFGVVLAEIITGKKVVDFNRGKGEVNLATLAVSKIADGHLDEIIDPLLETNINPAIRATIHRVAELAFRCLSFERDARPPMTEVLQELEQIQNEGISPVFHSKRSTSSQRNLSRTSSEAG